MNFWSTRAKNVLKAEMALQGIGYAELITKLEEIGIKASYKGVANKINRGTFTFAFFMQCMKALGRETVKLGEN